VVFRHARRQLRRRLTGLFLITIERGKKFRCPVGVLQYLGASNSSRSPRRASLLLLLGVVSLTVRPTPC
jgi:hypothetical protein